MFVINFIQPLLAPNIMSRVKLSKTSTKSYILQISAGIIFIIIIVLLLLNLLGMLRLNYGFVESLPALFHVFILFLIGFAINLFTFVLTQKESSRLGTVFIMLSIVDYKFLPEFIQHVLKFSPTYYFKELLDGFNLQYVLIQFGFLALFTTLTLITLKYKKVK